MTLIDGKPQTLTDRPLHPHERGSNVLCSLWITRLLNTGSAVYSIVAQVEVSARHREVLLLGVFEGFLVFLGQLKGFVLETRCLTTSTAVGGRVLISFY